MVDDAEGPPLRRHPSPRRASSWRLAGAALLRRWRERLAGVSAARPGGAPTLPAARGSLLRRAGRWSCRPRAQEGRRVARTGGAGRGGGSRAGSQHGERGAVARGRGRGGQAPGAPPGPGPLPAPPLRRGCRGRCCCPPQTRELGWGSRAGGPLAGRVSEHRFGKRGAPGGEGWQPLSSPDAERERLQGLSLPPPSPEISGAQKA